MSRFARMVMLGALGVALAACRSDLVAGLTARDRDAGQDAAGVADLPGAGGLGEGGSTGDGGAAAEGGSTGEGGAVAEGGAMAGGGGPEAVLEIEPPVLDFKEVAVGARGGPGVLTVRNTGNANSGALTISLGTSPLPRPFEVLSNECGMPLAARASCAILVAFMPQRTGLDKTPVTVSDGRAEATANLMGTGILARTLQLTPGTQDFGVVAIGGESPAIAFELRNLGDVDAGRITMTTFGEFAIKTNGCDRTLPPHQSCVLQVVFGPGERRREDRHDDGVGVGHDRGQ